MRGAPARPAYGGRRFTGLEAVLQYLSRTKFFGEGHRLSGLDPSLLGVEPLYKGAGQVRRFNTEAAAGRPKRNASSAQEAARRQTIAERRKASQGASATPSSTNEPMKESDNA